MRQAYLTCRIHREWYGIPIEYIVEVLNMVALNELPDSQLLGLLTLRDTLIPVLDLRAIFHSSHLDYKLDTPLIALQYQAVQLGLVVDETDDVLQFSSEQIQPYEDKYISQIARVGERIFFILDMEALLRNSPIHDKPYGR